MPGKMKAVVLLLAAGLSLPAAGCGRAKGPIGSTASGNPPPVLFVYAGADLKGPVNQLAQMYQKKTGRKVELTYNNMGTLLSQIAVSHRGDLLISGSMSYIQKARHNGDVTEVIGPLAYHVPVIITPGNNPAGIKGVRDLARPGVRLLMPDQKATAVGKDAFATFAKLRITKAVEKNVIAYLATPSQVLASILMGQGNAGIVARNDVGNQQGNIDVVAIDPSVNVVGEISCAVLSFSQKQKEAREFAAFLGKEAPAVFAAYGFPAAP